ncbi:Exporter protein, RND family [hydrothermal vent metagenome]|uniref:Exporter protein, RND family n=1 Tax=hydrothermal vent metagenome TaxID=652676 RepID=A0A3B1CS21_9ZZZZ
MKPTQSLTEGLFNRIVLKHPKIVLIAIFIFIAFMSYQAKNFRLDASADTLILEDDQDLRNTRDVIKRYGEQNFVVVTYTPKVDVFSPKTLGRIAQLQDDLNALEGVSSVLSLLDVPLLESPPIPLKELATNIITLRSPKVDLVLAKIEFQNSPIYQNMIVSPDLKTTALQVLFPVDQAAKDLLERRTTLRDKKRTVTLNPEEKKELLQVQANFQKHNDAMKVVRHRNITQIRAVMDGYRTDSELFLGGVSMIADDLITFIKKDLKLFGIGVLFFLILILKIIFGRTRWIVIPLLCCFFSTLAMAGFLGLFGWEVTVISSNFVSLQLIITMAMTIHLIVRYRELEEAQPEATNEALISQSVVAMFKPCLYAALTTIAGFASLVMSNILPVINFGWMMIAGITVSLLLTFLIFPVVLIFLDKAVSEVSKKPTFPLTTILANFTAQRGTLIIVSSGIAFLFSLVGISRLIVENSFIDYFKKSTEIYQGMKLIDQNLGGTTPLDVIINFDTPNNTAPDPITNTPAPNDEGDEFGDFDEFEDAENADKYWFTEAKMAQIKKIQTYLDGIPETGKVLSLGTMLQVAEKLNDGKVLDNFELAVLYEKLPPDIRALILTPYVSIADNQARFAIRVRDSEPTLKRDIFLKKIYYDLTHDLGLKPENVQITGMMVLYNNMLQSLFDSQIKTLGVTVSALIFMFLILFRSFKFSVIAIMPNLLSISIVLGMMGWLGIPLDMMTITIAAISVGIAVDDTIHYIHRFKREFQTDRNYIQAMHRSHESIGQAMYYTSITIVIGFSILTLSNFIPSIYFGLLTGLAMVIALIAAMTLLPQLIILIKPLGPEGSQQSTTEA